MNNGDLHIPISKTPILLSFIERILEFSGEFLVKSDLKNELFITCYSKNNKECHFICLTCNKPWNKLILGDHLIDTSKGIIVMRFYENGEMMIEGLMYEKFPYQAEIKRVLKGNFSPPSNKELLLLEDYFKDLGQGNMKTIEIDA